MAKSRVFSRPLPDANVPRNAFDMSKRISLNMPFGALIPVYSHQYIAGSHVKINMRTFFRTAAVNTAAFPQLKLNFEWFAVPLRYLWSYWDNFKLGIQDYNSTALFDSASISGHTNPSSVPLFYGRDLLNLSNKSFPATPGSSPNVPDAAGYTWGLGAARLADMLGYGLYSPSYSATDLSDLHTGQAYNPFKIAAYQKIYYDHFRNSAYESNDPFAYNFDQDTVTSSSYLGDLRLVKLFTLRYANYRKDYFQHIFPSLNYVTSDPSSPISSIPSWIQGADYSTTNGDSSLIQVFRDGTVVRTHPNNSNGYSYVSAQSLRALFALDKLTRSSAYAPKHVKEQYEARYGIKFSDKASFESERIGNFDTDIVIGEVTSTANTSGSSGDALGAIGGKGVGASDAKKGFVDYTCKEDCVVMCIAYAIPRQQYDSNRFENWNMKLVQNDFFIPEFMNLGLKPLYGKERNATFGATTVANQIIGYQTPYMEYKADVDENHGLFADPNSDLGQFVTHTRLSTSIPASADYFRVKPSDVDSIFVNAYDGSQSTDQLFGQIDFIIPVNQNMSVHGQPSL